MADRAASNISIRYGIGSGSGVTTIKVIDFSFDPEVKCVRSVVSGQIPVDPDTYTLCKPFTQTEFSGGILSATVFIDPSNTFMAALLNSISDNNVSLSGIPYYFSYEQVQWKLDVKEASGSGHGFNFGDSPYEGGDWIDGLIIPVRITGKCDDGGMIEAEIEIHSQLGVEYFSNL